MKILAKYNNLFQMALTGAIMAFCCVAFWYGKMDSTTWAIGMAGAAGWGGMVVNKFIKGLKDNGEGQ